VPTGSAAFGGSNRPEPLCEACLRERHRRRADRAPVRGPDRDSLRRRFFQLIVPTGTGHVSIAIDPDGELTAVIDAALGVVDAER
jgi:hypothetical protein